MAITLGLDTALSGLLSNQQALNTISQNVVNVNTPGYTRKVLHLESRVVGGVGAGVQVTAVQRNVDEGLLTYVRRDNAVLTYHDTLSDAYNQIESLFGKVGDKASVSHDVQSVLDNLVRLSATPDKADVQSATVQSAQALTNRLAMLTEQLQGLRASADQKIETDCNEINSLLANIHDLNGKIVRSLAVDIDATDLQDRRDQALNSLSKLMDVQYYNMSDGSVTIGTSQGDVLINSSQYFPLSHSGLTTSAAWMSRDAGQFSGIILSVGAGTPRDITDNIKGGDLRANIDLRDTIVPNLQAQIDQLSVELKDTLNLAHNRGVTLPMPSSQMTGSRTFADQDNLKQSISLTGTQDTALIIYDSQGNQQATTTLRALMDGSAFSPATTVIDQPWTLESIATRMQSWLRDQTYLNHHTAKVGLDADGHFSIDTGNTDYGLAFRDQADSTPGAAATDITVTFHADTPLAVTRNTLSIGPTTALIGASLDGTANTVANGDTLTLRLNGIDHTITMAALPAPGTTGQDVVDQINAITGLRASFVTDDAGVSRIQVINSSGHALSMSSPTSASLRSLGLATVAQATPDEVVQGFSNFLGLNDLFVSSQPRSLIDSEIVATGTTLGTQRKLSLYDQRGAVGPEMTFAAGSSLSDIAAKINRNSTVLESALIPTNSLTMAADSTFTIRDATGAAVASIFRPAGTSSLQDIADAISSASSSLSASVVQDGGGYRLRVWDTGGAPLSVTYEGSASQDMRNKLNLATSQKFVASVVDEGSGQRLRIRQADNDDCYFKASIDSANTSLLTDLGLATASCGGASAITVRSAIVSDPSKLSRAATHWNADTQRYYASTGDSNIATQMVTAFQSKQAIDGAGRMATARYSLTDYATLIVSMTAQDIGTNTSQLSYHTTLNSNLNTQIQSKSGVNLDEEVANMINFQQAYSASAKVISTLNDMLETLIGIVR